MGVAAALAEAEADAVVDCRIGDSLAARATAPWASSYRLRIISFSCDADMYAGVLVAAAVAAEPNEAAGGEMGRLDELGAGVGEAARPKMSSKSGLPTIGVLRPTNGAVDEPEVELIASPVVVTGGVEVGIDVDVDRLVACGGGDAVVARCTRFVASSYLRRIVAFSSAADMYCGAEAEGTAGGGGTAGEAEEVDCLADEAAADDDDPPAALLPWLAYTSCGDSERNCVGPLWLELTRLAASSYRLRMSSFSSAAERYAGAVVELELDASAPAAVAAAATPIAPTPAAVAPGTGDAEFVCDPETTRPCASSNLRRIISFSSAADKYGADWSGGDWSVAALALPPAMLELPPPLAWRCACARWLSMKLAGMTVCISGLMPTCIPAGRAASGAGAGPMISASSGGVSYPAWWRATRSCASSYLRRTIWLWTSSGELPELLVGEAGAAADPPAPEDPRMDLTLFAGVPRPAVGKIWS